MSGVTITDPWKHRVEAGDWEAITAEVSSLGGALLQSRGTATLLPHGRGYVFTTRDRPVWSARSWSAAPVQHGVSVVRSGQQHTLGLVFHDAP